MHGPLKLVATKYSVDLPRNAVTRSASPPIRPSEPPQPQHKLFVMATSGRDEKASRARLMQLMGGLQKEDGPPPRSSLGGGGGGGGGVGAGRSSRKTSRSVSSTSSGTGADMPAVSTSGDKKGRSRKRPLKSSSASSNSKTSPSKTTTAINDTSNWSGQINDSSSIAQIALWGRLKIGGFVPGEEDKAVLSPVLARSGSHFNRPCTSLQMPRHAIL